MADGRQARAQRRLALVVVIALSAVISGFLVSVQRQRATWERERIQTQERLDSMQVVPDGSVQAREGRIEGSGAAVRQAPEPVRQVGAEVTWVESRGDTVPPIPPRPQPQPATAALQRQPPAAALDLRAIQRANRPAVAMIFVETEEGEIATATAFAVRTDATLRTSRHVITGAEGRQRVRRIAIQFSDSEQV